MEKSETRVDGERAAVIKKQGPVSFESIVGLISILSFIAAWQIASLFAPAYAIPGWDRIFDALLRISYFDAAVSILRVLVSMIFSFVLGLSFSILVFGRPIAEAYWLPLVRLLMAVPAVCWVIFAILWFPSVELRIFFVMCVVCTPVFIVDSLDAMKSVPLELRQMVESFRPRPLQRYSKIIFPAIIPNLLTSWKINLTLAVRVVTIAELVGAVSGIGHGLVLAQEMFSVAEVFAWTVVLIAILLSFQAVVIFLERRLLRWRTA